MNCGDCCLIPIFAEQVQKYPQNIALKYEEGSLELTYEELDHCSDLLSRIILGFIDFVPQDGEVDTPLVSLMVDRNFSMIISIIACWKAGAGYVPVDPSFPADRQAYIFSHSRCSLLIADESSYAEAIKIGVELPSSVIVVNGTTGGLVTNSSSLIISNKIFLSRTLKGSDLAYVLYTSGSTGKPKGVMVPQQGVVNYIDWLTTEMGAGPSSVVLALATYCFDISVLEFLLPLLNGGTLVIASVATQKDPYRIIDVLEERKVNVFQATPTTYEMMVATGWKGNERIDFITGGEAFRPSLVTVIDHCRSFRNVYGPTETTIYSSCHNFNGIHPQTNAIGTLVVSVGVPINQTQFYLVDPDGSLPYKEVPTGAEGELWIGGIGVARGYIRAPDLTEKRFIANPFGEGRVYRTGDLFRQLPDGNYVFLRRLDDQVKLNGYRIELGEIELMFQSHPYVELAVALVRKDQLVVYLKPAQRKSLGMAQIEEVKEHAAKSLTKYMMPKHIMVLEEFPQTLNRKLDRNALPDPQDLKDLKAVVPTHHSESVNIGAIQTDLEAGLLRSRHLDEKRHRGTLVDYICDLIYRVRGQLANPNTTFASIGVDSLGAVMFVRFLSDSLGGIRISPNDLFRRGVTVQSYAKTLQDKVLAEKPEVLTELGLHLIAVEAEDECGKLGCLEAGEYEISDDRITADLSRTSKEEETFEDRLNSNREVLEGMRGLFMLFVYWDHYHGRFPVGDAIGQDTGMFVVLTGFVTALQLRPHADDPNELLKVPHERTREPFHLINFLKSRALGVFPTLWLTLLISTPWWYNHDVLMLRQNSSYSIGDVITCDVLYPLGLQGWDRTKCNDLGPNTVLYASILWNCFIMYGCIRFIMDRIQMKMRAMSKMNAQTAGTGWTFRVINFLLDLADNKLKGELYWWMLGAWFAAFGGLFVSIYFFYSKAPIAFMVIFYAGVTTASVLEITFKKIQALSPIGKYLDNTSPRSSILIRAIRQIIPDLILAAILLMCSLVGPRRSHEVDEGLRNHGMLFCTMFLILSLLLQDDSTRTCITRTIFEFPVLRWIGYSSYQNYLLQDIVLEFYLRIIYNAVVGVPLDYNPESPLFANTSGWYSNLRTWWKAVGLVIIVSVSYAVQYYFADSFIPWVYIKISNYFSKRASSTHQIYKRPSMI